MKRAAADDEPVYLELADALELYAAMLGGTVSEAGDQLRNRSGLESALARPRSYAHYEDADLALQGAMLAHGVAEGKTQSERRHDRRSARRSDPRAASADLLTQCGCVGIRCYIRQASS